MMANLKSFLKGKIQSITLCIILTFLLVAYNEPSDRSYPDDYFRSPLDIPIILSGTFGEPRGSHFHSGIDIKTEGIEGLPVYSTAEGYISRIKVSTYGYGKALYITHPNGYETVYAHLQKFAPDIEEYVRRNQYARESYALQLYPKKNQLSVMKGQVIAFSGNSGGSQAPHLHYEIRDSRTAQPLNGLFFGYKVPDTIPPVLNALALYNRDKKFYYHEPVRVKVIKDKGNYILPSDTDTLYINAKKVGIGIDSYDLLNEANNNNGVFSIELLEDGRQKYYFEMDRFSFRETRYVKAHMDYRFSNITGQRFHTLFQIPGNDLSIYETIRDQGTIDLSDHKAHIQLKVKDYAGNESTLNFHLRYITDTTVDKKEPDHDQYFERKMTNIFRKPGVAVEFPAQTFYTDIYFDYEKTETADSVFSPIHRLHRPEVPAHKYFRIYLQPEDLPDHLKEKALIIYKNPSGYISSKGGNWENDFLVTRTRELGEYYISADTVKPKIRQVNISNGKNMQNEPYLRLKISDDLSGIDTYRAEVDGKWILMEYDYKTGYLTHYWDGKIGSGEHELAVKVTDNKNNISLLNLKFRR